MGGNKSKETYISIEPSSPCRIAQNFLLVWLDSNIDNENNDCHSTINYLRRIVNSINLFTDIDQCIHFLTQVKNEKVFLIVSGILGQCIISRIHDMLQLDSVYVFCKDQFKHEQWGQQWAKVKGVFTQITPVCDLLKQAAQECDQNSISISCIRANDDMSNQSLDQLDPRFMYTQILEEILLEIKYDKQYIKDLADYCRGLYANNEHEMKTIAKFEREYHRHSAIWWYTYDCCIYSMLNRALRIQEVDTLIKMGVFIRDLHLHIQKLHKEQFHNQEAQSFTVYRGQCLSNTDFDKLKQAKGGLISFNNFLSTSMNRDVSIEFTRHSIKTNPKSIGILFKMFIDPSITLTPFAHINKVSYYKDSEEEILFSMHTIFRIGNIELIDDDDDDDNNNQIWQVELTLTDNKDKQLSILTGKIREETQKETGWSRLGSLLIRLGKFDAAEEVYNVLLNLTSDDFEKAHFYHQTGVIKKNQKFHHEAISNFQKSLEIYAKTLSPYHPILATSYNNIGSVYNNMGEYCEALSYHKQAIEIEEYILPSNHLSLAITHNNIGLVLNNMGEYSKALSFYQKTLDVYRKTLPSNHPYVAAAYNNIALVYKKMEDYSQSLQFYQYAVSFGERSLAPDHPHLQLYKKNLQFVKKKLYILSQE